jgi:RHS repeat-associated protein
VGNLETVRHGNGVTNRYHYDSLNRLTNLVAGTPTATLASFAYRLAPAGNRTNLSETVGGQSRTFTWQYDPLYRLTNEVITGAAPTGTISYRYDAVGNRTNRTSTVGGITNQTFAYTANDWLTTDVYDANGNTRTNAGDVFRYDVENRLTNAVVGGTSITIVYDGDGNRVRKIVGTTTNTYLVCRQNRTGYAQVLEERVNGSLSRVYAYGLDLMAQRDVASGATLYFGYDGLANTRYLTATNAAVANVFAYDAFGTLIASNTAPQTDYLFTGEQRDPNLGFTYLRARYLNPGTGRFWTRDTHPGSRSEPPSLHRYTYCGNDPVNRLDPSGHEYTAAGTISVGGIWGGFAGIQLPAISAAKIKILSVAIAATLTLTGDRAHGDFVYRRLSDRESRTPYMQVGLFATDPTAYWVTPDDHIGRKQKPSPWISTSRNFMVPAKRYLDPDEASNARNSIVKIDLRRVGTTYLDFTNPLILATLQTPEARASALIDSEVLIWGFVSPVAIVASYDGTRLLE